MADLIWEEVNLHDPNLGVPTGPTGIFDAKYSGFTTRSNAKYLNVASFERSGMRHMHRGEYWTELQHCE